MYAEESTRSSCRRDRPCHGGSKKLLCLVLVVLLAILGLLVALLVLVSRLSSPVAMGTTGTTGPTGPTGPTGRRGATGASGGSSANVTQVVLEASGTYVPSPGTTSIVVECIGGGAAGGGALTSGEVPSASAGGGGGSGAYSRVVVQNPAATSYVVGAGGLGFPAGAGGDGGTTTFGAGLCVAQGGAGTGFVSVSIEPIIGLADGGPGGASSGTGYSAAGSPGGVGEAVITENNQAAFGGVGGASEVGDGAVQRIVQAQDVALGLPGNSGLPYGGGGSGAASVNTDLALAGGNGAPGVIVVTEFH